MTDGIPNTLHAHKMRVIHDVMLSLGDCPYATFEEFYASQSVGGTPNGRALAALLFYRALNYWPEYFTPADGPAVAAWGDMLDNYPLFTPDIIEAAVDGVHAAGIREPGAANFIRLARQMVEDTTNG